MITLTVRLICTTEAEAARVRAHLDEHIRLTLAEPGCISFEQVETGDPLVFQINEAFTDRAAFEQHQARTKASRWVMETGDIRREGRQLSES